MTPGLVFPHVAFDPATVWALCEQYGLELRVTADLDGARMLWALAGCESSFGRNCTQRHESTYCTGKYSTNPLVIALTQKYGHDAHCSFGPLQILLVNCQDATPQDLRSDPEVGIREATGFINRRILGAEHATTVAAIADAYNSGDWRDRIVPEKYIGDASRYYTAGMQPGPAPIIAGGE